MRGPDGYEFTPQRVRPWEAWLNGGVCTLTKPEISEILGCSRSVVRNALQFARDVDLISGEARHIEISASWRRWLEQSGVAASP